MSDNVLDYIEPQPSAKQVANVDAAKALDVVPSQVSQADATLSGGALQQTPGLAPGFQRGPNGMLTRNGQPPDIMFPGGIPGWMASPQGPATNLLPKQDPDTQYNVGQREQPTPPIIGPATAELVVQGGLPADQASDIASFENWVSHAEGAPTFRTMYGGGEWGGPLSTHPKYLGYSGGNAPDGRQTHPFGFMQDQPDTWLGISQRYLGGDTNMSPVNQVKGNWLHAVDIYKQKTGGRDLITDWRAGMKESIAANLSSEWEGLKNSAGGGGGVRGAMYPGYQAAMDHYNQAGAKIDKLVADMDKAAPGSDEMHALLRRAIQRSDELQDRFIRMSEKPPVSQSPWESASSFAPLLIGLMTLAGGFSKRPALGAMNALAGGLEGLKQGNDEQYKRSMDVWSKQTELASKAFSMQNDTIKNIYDDLALTERERQDKLMNAYRLLGMDIELQNAKQGLWAENYDRNQAAIKLHGDMELQQAHIEEARAKAAKDRAAAQWGGRDDPFHRSLFNLEQDYRIKNNIPEGQAIPYDAEQELIEKAHTSTTGRAGAAAVGTEAEHIQTTKAIARENKAKQLGVPVDDPKAALTREEEGKAELQGAEEFKKAESGGRTSGTAQGQLLSTIEEKMKQDNVAAGREPDLTAAQKVDAEVQANVLRHAASISGNKVVDIENQVNAFDQGLIQINNAFGLMAKHGLITGAGGTFTRPIEALSNYTHISNTADRRQFESNIQLLREMAPRLLALVTSGTASRPLASEAAKVDAVVRGLNAGDTPQATTAALVGLRDVFTMARAERLSQIPPGASGGWKPMDAPTSKNTPYLPSRTSGVGGGGGGGGGVGVLPQGVSPGQAVVATPGLGAEPSEFDSYPRAQQ